MELETKVVLHTQMTGEIVLSIFIGREKYGAFSMGTDPKFARDKAKKFLEAMKNVNEFTDQIT